MEASYAKLLPAICDPFTKPIPACTGREAGYTLAGHRSYRQMYSQSQPQVVSNPPELHVSVRLEGNWTQTERKYSCEREMLHQNNRSGTSAYQTILCFPICHRQISFQSSLAEGRDVYSKAQLYFFCQSTSNKPMNYSCHKYSHLELKERDAPNLYAVFKLRLLSLQENTNCACWREARHFSVWAICCAALSTELNHAVGGPVTGLSPTPPRCEAHQVQTNGQVL